MDFLIANLSLSSKSNEVSMMEKLLKEIPYGSKTKSPENTFYNFVLIPIVEEKFEVQNNYIRKRITALTKLEESDFLFLGNFFKDSKKDFPSLVIDVILKGNENDLEILYSDGSVSKESGNSSYAVCKLLEESEEGTLDNFTNKKYNFKTISEVIENGTNNIGELSGIKKAIEEEIPEGKIKLIISDSEYSIKSFREWIYSWKQNNFKTYSGKPISNKELIESSYNILKSKREITIFKWTKGHNKDSFNEICDKKAKEILGIGGKKEKDELQN